MLLEQNDIDNDINNNLNYTKTDFNIYANIVVLGKNFHITNYTSRIAEVQPFPLEYESLYQGPIVDTIIQYDDPCTIEI